MSYANLIFNALRHWRDANGGQRMKILEQRQKLLSQIKTIAL
ncbi:hypothetical protein ACX12L_16055 [Alicycliphilus sp. T452]